MLPLLLGVDDLEDWLVFFLECIMIDVDIDVERSSGSLLSMNNVYIDFKLK